MRQYHPGVDVVVCNYRTPADLRDFIRSFVAVQWEVPATLHVINVVPSTADVATAAIELELVEVPTSYAQWPMNVGYASACNAAAEAAARGGEERATIAFFNADTRLTPGVLDACHWHLQQNHNVGIVGPRQYDDEGLITHGGIYGTREKPSFEGRWKAKDTGQYNDIREDCVSVAGSAYFVSRYCWDGLVNCPEFRAVAPLAAGAFLPTQHYYEETYCSYHALQHGWKIAYLGTVGMVHKWHKASDVGGNTERTVLPKSREYFRAACDLHGIPHD